MTNLNVILPNFTEKSCAVYILESPTHPVPLSYGWPEGLVNTECRGTVGLRLCFIIAARYSGIDPTHSKVLEAQRWTWFYCGSDSLYGPIGLSMCNLINAYPDWQSVKFRKYFIIYKTNPLNLNVVWKSQFHVCLFKSCFKIIILITFIEASRYI